MRITPVLVLLFALAGCGTSAFHVVAAASPAAQSSCGFYAPDGSYTAIVLAAGSVCGTLSSDLAQDGVYWAPFTGANTGTKPPLCSLSSGNSTITVYDPTAVQEPVGGSVAQGVCASEEANGWHAA